MRVLIADDDATSRLLLKAIVTKLGHECLVASDGSSAENLLGSEQIDVLLTDWLMPGVDGPELCRRVRDDLNGHYIYIVLITGLGNPERALEGMSAGADDYLIKPADPFALQTRLIAAQRVTTLHRQVADFRSQLEHANLELLDRSLTDALTGLGNRRRMDEDLARTHARAVRAGRGYCVALFDVDQFKLYNDHLGHLAGDNALRQVAQCLTASLRSGENAYRYGGEEFLVVLPDCPLDDAMNAATRLREALISMAIPHSARTAAPFIVTVSGGVSSWTPETLDSVDDLLRAADAALSAAKSAGRNQVHTQPAPQQAAVGARARNPMASRIIDN